MSFWTKLPAFWRVRFAIFVSAVMSLSLLLGIRLIHVQLVQGAEFKLLADDNRFYSLSIPAERGIFLDRYGNPMAWNTHRYYQVTNPEDIHHLQEPIDRADALQLIATQSGSVVTTLERLYKYPESLSHVLGYIGAVTPEELADGRANSIGELIGKLGLELSQNKVLRGVNGKEMYEINAIGQRQKLVQRVEPVAGTNVATTIDPYLSQVAYQALGQKKGVVVILDVQTGDVLSLVSSPAFNANYLTQVSENNVEEQERQQQIRAMFTDERQLFFNRAVDGLYPPGSVFKLITALAGLEEEKLDQDTEVLDEGVLKVGEYEYGNWYFRQYGQTEGSISLVRAISRSNDIYFYKAAEWVGPTAIADMARLFGFGKRPGIQLEPQAQGLVPDPAWKEQTLGERWYLGNTYHFGIGQGDLLVSPIQMAQMMQSIGHQGTLCPPTLLADNPSKCVELGVKQEYLELVLQGMLYACSNGGTAFPFFPYNQERIVDGNSIELNLANGAIACKTGTAEFGGADERDRRKTHGWFAALTEFDSAELIAAEAQPQIIDEQATPSAITVQTNVINGMPERNKWVDQISKQGFPRQLVFVALVESDDEQPFVEGSREAAPVIKSIIDWMWGS